MLKDKYLISYMLNKTNKITVILFIAAISVVLSSSFINAKKISVNTASQFKTAVTTLMAGDTLEVENGTYDLNTYLNITSSGTASLPIVIRAKNIGGAVLINKSFFDFKQVSYVILEGFDFKGKDGTAIKMESCNYVRITKNYFRLTETTSQKWILIGGTWDKPDLTSANNRIDHNLFENKAQPGNFITVDGTPSPTYIPSRYDLIDHNHFKNSSPRVTNEKEAVRLGQSNFSASSAFSVVEYNLFENCDGDPEFLSVKTCNDTIRYNTFLNSMGTLCLRQGKGSVAYNNYFFGSGKDGTGGIRVYGSDHKIYNNYMENLNGDTWDAAITLTNGDVENNSTSMSSHFRPENIFVGFNTVINCRHNIQIGFTNNGSYTKPPRNITFANNLISGNYNELVKIFTTPVNVTWASNIINAISPAVVGITYVDSEIKNINPVLDTVNGIKRLASGSPLINTAKTGFSFIKDDIDGQLRDSLPDIGADEYSSANITNKPLTSNDVGPLSEKAVTFVNNYKNELPEKFILYPNYPNPFNPSTTIKYYVYKNGYVKLKIVDLLGREIADLVNEYQHSGIYSITLNADRFKMSSGIYFCILETSGSKKIQKITLIK